MSFLDVIKFQHDILQCANHARPFVDFLIDVDKLLLSLSGADAIENLFKESDRFSRWEMQKGPERFYRLADLPIDLVKPKKEVTRFLFHDYKEAWDVHLGTRASEVLENGCSALHLKEYALFRLGFGDDLKGFVMYKNRKPFSQKTREALQHCSQTLAFVMAFQEIRHAQRERVKELTCLYRIGRATSTMGAEIDAILQRVVECLPPAWQYPEITRARIRIDQKVFETHAQREARHMQRAEIVVAGVRRGVVEVEYVEDRPDLDEGPFLDEERRLLDLVAGDIAFVLEQKRADAERLKLEEQVRRADKLATIGQLTAGVTHELNEPLGSILGFTQLAKKNPELPPQVRDDLSKIESASLYAREVIRKLMLFARQTPSYKTPASINRVVRDSVALLNARAANLGIAIECRLAENLPRITADPSQITQMVVNLVVNAIQATPSGGTVVIETASEGNDVVLAVIDTGVGICDEDKERLFEPFFTTKSAGEGTGLGLPVVHGIVAAHKGKIEVISEVGAGSQFRVILPNRGFENET